MKTISEFLKDKGVDISSLPLVELDGRSVGIAQLIMEYEALPEEVVKEENDSYPSGEHYGVSTCSPDLPKEVLELMVAHQVNQGNDGDIDIFRVDPSALRNRGGFDWSNSDEVDNKDAKHNDECNVIWWSDVIYGNHKIFFDKYPTRESLDKRISELKSGNQNIAIRCLTIS